jgi:hypothetical protein
MENLMKAVPELEYISIWTNDSGAGFEYTSTLYVGRNGGAYLIREWKSNEEIANRAGENIMRFMKLLRDAARKTNPQFRVIGRLEALSAERHVIDREIGNGIDVEVATLLSKGFHSPYHHPLYEDVTEVLGTILHNSLDMKEKAEIAELKQKDCRTHLVYGIGNVNSVDSLLGTPAPWLILVRNIWQLMAASIRQPWRTGPLIMKCGELSRWIPHWMWKRLLKMWRSVGSVKNGQMIWLKPGASPIRQFGCFPSRFPCIWSGDTPGCDCGQDPWFPISKQFPKKIGLIMKNS